MAEKDPIALRDYLVNLVDDHRALGEFKLDRKAAVEKSNLSDEHKEMLLHSDWTSVRTELRGHFGGAVDCIFLVM